MRVTYVLGAGASADSIPTVAQMPRRMQDMASKVKRAVRDEEFNEKGEVLKFCENLILLSAKAIEYNSIDSYAQAVFEKTVNDRIGFDEIKANLSYYIALEQMMNPIQNRYLHLLTKINRHLDFSEKDRIRTTVNFISWNYDVQLEQCLSNRPEMQQSSIADTINMTQFDDSDGNKLRIVHLNGVAGVYKTKSKLMDIYNRATSSKLFDLVQSTAFFLRDFHRGQIDISSCMTFYWENNLEYDAKIEEAREIINSSSLVIYIGYSFPDDNVEADEKILKVLDGKYTDIIVQKRTPNIESIGWLNNLKLKKSIQSRTDVKNFHIPPELLKYREGL